MNALILWSAHPEAAVAFYRAIGLALEEERHDDGPLHWACELGPVHLAVYPATVADAGAAPPRSHPGATMPGFAVDSLDATLTTLRATGVPILIPAEDVGWGRRAVVSDPDGRSVEISESPRP